MEEDFKDSIIVTRLETIDGGSYSKVYRIFIDGTEIKAEEVLYVATTDLKIENLLLYGDFMLYRSEEQPLFVAFRTDDEAGFQQY